MPALAVGATPEEVDQADAQPDAEEALPERVDEGVRVRAPFEQRRVVGRVERQRHRHEQQDQEAADRQPEAAGPVGQRPQPVTPVGQQAGDEEGNVLGEVGELQVEGLEAPVDRKDQAHQEGGGAQQQGEQGGGARPGEAGRHWLAGGARVERGARGGTLPRR